MYVSKVVPSPQDFIQTARLHSTRAELFRNPASPHGIVYQCGVRTVLFAVSRIAIAYFRSEKIQDKVSQKHHPKNDYFSVVQYNQFDETGCVSRRDPGQGRPCVAEETMENVRHTFVFHSLRKYQGSALVSVEWKVAKTTMWKILKKLLLHFRCV